MSTYLRIIPLAPLLLLDIALSDHQEVKLRAEGMGLLVLLLTCLAWQCVNDGAGWMMVLIGERYIERKSQPAMRDVDTTSL